MIIVKFGNLIIGFSFGALQLVSFYFLNLFSKAKDLREKTVAQRKYEKTMRILFPIIGFFFIFGSVLKVVDVMSSKNIETCSYKTEQKTEREQNSTSKTGGLEHKLESN